MPGPETEVAVSFATAAAPEMTITGLLDEFAYEALVSEDRCLTRGADSSLEAAIGLYLADQSQDVIGWLAPQFQERCPSVRALQRITIHVGDGVWREVVAEADRQCISTRELLEQAAFYYAAQAETGRLGESDVSGPHVHAVRGTPPQ